MLVAIVLLLSAGLSDNLAFFFVMLGVKNGARHAFRFQERRKIFVFVYRNGADQNRLAGLMNFLYFPGYGLKLALDGLKN